MKLIIGIVLGWLMGSALSLEAGDFYDQLNRQMQNQIQQNFYQQELFNQQQQNWIQQQMLNQMKRPC